MQGGAVTKERTYGDSVSDVELCKYGHTNLMFLCSKAWLKSPLGVATWGELMQQEPNMLAPALSETPVIHATPTSPRCTWQLHARHGAHGVMRRRRPDGRCSRDGRGARS